MYAWRPNFRTRQMGSAPTFTEEIMLRRSTGLAALVLSLFALPANAQESTEVVFHGNPESVLSSMVVAGNTVYLSGVLGNRAGPEIEEQTRMVMETIRDRLAEVGGTMDDVVKCLVFMADLSERPRLNEVYASFFPNYKPARSAVGVDLGGPKVEIECIAVLTD